ncbi:MULTISPECIES: hypothetical protein [unclassified Mesorhizobium]|uniref:hypothetical protein n=1 Tax=unclassified Mesorhizobium TaxID=325217 RepID=UPI0003D04D5F|nr:MULTISPECIES: hypothetical protein [unclassified Mesorhizobium]ESZ02725.1 hypothetical protein X736_29130 [Mesorhizobium sp. L2C089B000]WJI49057.1 hypothetical protein NLY44_20625 [Mesorhizobium sp. C089B]
MAPVKPTIEQRVAELERALKLLTPRVDIMEKGEVRIVAKEMSERPFDLALWTAGYGVALERWPTTDPKANFTLVWGAGKRKKPKKN